MYGARRKGISTMNTTWKHTVVAVTIWLAVLATAVSITAPCSADDFLIGSECQIASVTAPAVDLRGQVSIAAGAGTYLAVWRDHRGGTTYDIYGTFVDADGDPLGDESFLITCDANGDPTAGSKNHPSVAFNGTNFLVVWDAAPSTISDIYGTRVSPTGQVLDPNGFQISMTTYADNETLPVVASNGTDWQLVWQQGGSTLYTSIAGATVAGATRIVTRRISIAAGSESHTVLTPTIASNGLTGTASRYFVAWEDRVFESDILGCRINNTGAKIAGSDIVVSNKVGSPTVGATGAQFGPSVTGGKDSAGADGGWMVAWEDAPITDSGSMTDVRVTRITAAGAVQDTGGTLIFDDYGKYYSDWNFYYSKPEVGWNGLSYEVVCRNGVSNKRAFGCPVGYDGVPGTITQLTTGSASQYGMGIAGGLGTFGGCVLALEYSGSSNIGGCYIRQTGVGTTERTISLSKQDQQQCAAAWDGFRQVAVWADRRNGTQNSRIYAARVRPNGTCDDPQGVEVSPSTYEQTQPAIAWDPVDACYLVVWRQGTAYQGTSDIKGMRLSPSLTPMGPELTLCSYDMDRTNPSVAWNGSNFLAVWADNRPTDGTWDIYGVRVSGAGVVSASTVYVSTSAGNQLSPSVAAGGSGNWLVTWQDDYAMRYEYAIGTSYGATNTVNWTSAGTANEITKTGLSLGVGYTYYISVRTINRDGTKSAIGCSDGITVVASAAPAAGQKMSILAVPTSPEVTDDGDTTTIKTSLHATWTPGYDSNEPAIMTRIVPNSGTLGTERSVSTRGVNKGEPKVAFNGTNYLVVWSESSTAIHGALMSSSNTRVTADPAGDIVVTTGTAIGSHPSVTWTGDKFVVIWEDRRDFSTSKNDIYGARITAAGAVQDNAGGLLVSQSAKGEYGPFIACVSSAQCLAYYTNFTSSINRLRARAFWTITPPPPEVLDRRRETAGERDAGHTCGSSGDRR